MYFIYFNQSAASYDSNDDNYMVCVRQKSNQAKIIMSGMRTEIDKKKYILTWIKINSIKWKKLKRTQASEGKMYSIRV